MNSKKNLDNTELWMKVVENATNLKNIGDSVNEIKISLRALHTRIDTFPDTFVSKEDHELAIKNHQRDYGAMSGRINALEELRESATNLIIKTTFKFTVAAVSIAGSILFALSKVFDLL